MASGELVSLTDLILNILKEEFKPKRLAKRINADCVLITAELENDALLIALSKGYFKAKYIVKITKASKLGGLPWSCDTLEYVPHGLYLIALSGDEVMNRLRDKVIKVLKQP